jgi:hypothetical protein
MPPVLKGTRFFLEMANHLLKSSKKIWLAFFIPDPVIYNGPLVGQPGFT